MIEEIVFGQKIDGINYLQRPGVYGIAFNDEGEVAVIKTSTGYFLPGGGIEGDETHQECIEREIVEETGYSIRIREFIGKASKYHYSDTMKCYMHGVGHFYIVTLKDKVKNEIEDDHLLLWLEPNRAIECLFLEHQAWAILRSGGND